MTSLDIRGSVALVAAVHGLLSSRREELTALFGQSVPTKQGHLIIVNDAEPADEKYVERSVRGLRWDARLTQRWTTRVEETGESLLLLHAHTNSGLVQLSRADIATCERLLDHLSFIAPNQCHAYGVVGNNAVAGAFCLGDLRGDISTFTATAGPVVRRTSRESPDYQQVRGDRQTMALGVAAERCLRDATVAVVGLGGGGSIVAEQLAHMRVGRLVLVDPDVLKEVNLSRQACAAVADLGRPKVTILAAAIERDCAQASTAVVEAFPGPQSYELLKTVDVIVSCVDSAHARNEINRFARRFRLPVVDIGVTIRSSRERITKIAGHVLRVVPDGPCLECEELTTVALRAAEQGEHRVPYRDGGEVAGAPQVMSLNGILASVAATEVLKLLTGFAPCSETVHWRFDGMENELYRRGATAHRCPTCELTGQVDDLVQTSPELLTMP
jgi:molybdopterin-synthase adenylyltransferase